MHRECRFSVLHRRLSKFPNKIHRINKSYPKRQKAGDKFTRFYKIHKVDAVNQILEKLFLSNQSLTTMIVRQQSSWTLRGSRNWYRRENHLAPLQSRVEVAKPNKDSNSKNRRVSKNRNRRHKWKAQRIKASKTPHWTRFKLRRWKWTTKSMSRRAQAQPKIGN